MAKPNQSEEEQMEQYRKTGQRPQPVDMLPDADVDLILCEWFDHFTEGLRFRMKYDLYEAKTRKFTVGHVHWPPENVDWHGYHFAFAFVNGSLFHAQLISSIDLAKFALALVGHLDRKAAGIREGFEVVLIR